jgi:eukaryotic-like serine/threonine-protein kinase
VGLAALGRDVLVARRDGSLERWGASPEERRWRAELSAPATTPPTVHGALAFVASEDGWLHALDLAAGRPRFKVEVGPMVAPAVAADRLLLLPTRSGELHAFDVAQHEVAWTYDLEGELWSSPAVGGRHVYVASWGDHLHALALRTGDDAWSRPLAQPVTAAPVLAGGAVYLVTEGGELLVFDARSGQELARYRVAPGAVQASVLPLGDAVLVAALDGTLTCLG